MEINTDIQWLYQLVEYTDFSFHEVKERMNRFYIQLDMVEDYIKNDKRPLRWEKVKIDVR